MEQGTGLKHWLIQQIKWL